MPVGYIHLFIRKLASGALASFFREIHVIGEENVPLDGPVILCCTHHNMIIDPAVLFHFLIPSPPQALEPSASVVAFRVDEPGGIQNQLALANTVHNKRPLMYWAKASLFQIPFASKVLFASGVIPVDRGAKDNHKLFAGTFKALSDGNCVALFPEGTSYTLPRIIQVKDGASWAVLEYMKWVQEGKAPKGAMEAPVVPVGITYTNKSKYRSSVVIEYGKPISMDEFREQFTSTVQGEPRLAVKRLTHRIEQEMVGLTVNAPDWETLLCGQTARNLLWDDGRNINLDDFRFVSQTLVDLFTSHSTNESYLELKRTLMTYHSLLKTSHLTNETLALLPLPRNLDPRRPTPFPSRITTFLVLIRDTISALLRLPLFLVPLLVHFPMYAISRWVGKQSEVEEETMAQNKVVVGMLGLLVAYGTMFWFIWALLGGRWVNGVIAAVTVYIFGIYHVRLIDDNYLLWKRLITAWRVLVGVWVPKKWDLSMAAVLPYTVNQPPPPNPFLKLPPEVEASLNRSTSSPSLPTLATTYEGDKPGKELKDRGLRRPPSRRLVRHVLRVRAESMRLLAAYLLSLDQEGVKVPASLHMVNIFGGGVQPPSPTVATSEATCDKVDGGGQVEGKIVHGGVEIGPSQEGGGWRDGREVIKYLCSRDGNKVNELFIRYARGSGTARGSGAESEGEWAALSSEGEDDAASPRPEEEQMTWVPPTGRS